MTHDWWREGNLVCRMIMEVGLGLVLSQEDIADGAGVFDFQSVLRVMSMKMCDHKPWSLRCFEFILTCRTSNDLGTGVHMERDDELLWLW